jgi:hypothetical protein
MNKFVWISLSIIVLGVVIFSIVSFTSKDIETPDYKVLKTIDEVELRLYPKMIVAKTSLSDKSFENQGSNGFRTIANYIFGGNEKNQKIAMTAPVTVEPQAAESSMKTAKTWRINFVMPSQYNLATIPKPKNNAVTLREVPSKYFIVHKYSGFNTVSRVQAKTDEAVEWAIKRSYKIIGTPQLSRYDPPWTLPMFRRNEIMIDIAAP